MKKQLIFAILFAAFGANAQVTEIRSIELDRMIWEEINVYRQSLGRKPVAYFDSTELRQVSFRLTELNASRENIDHTRDPQYRFKGYHTECIFAWGHKAVPAKNNPLYDSVLTQDEMRMLAKTTVQGWIDSDNHNYLISGKYVKYSTITSIVQVDNKSIRLIVSYHDICPDPKEFSNYY
jgi:uncharacterized protein YkwD